MAVIVPPARIREEAWRTVYGYRHVLLTNYEQIRELPAVLRSKPPDLVIADEAHRLRNRGARVTTGAFALRPLRFWALTGTPVERDQQDIATLLSLVLPTRFAPDDARLHIDSLRSRAREHILRRRKEQVLDDLPAVLDTTEAIDLTHSQESRYRMEVREYRANNKVGDELALLTRLQALCDIDPDSGESSKVERTLFLLKRIRDRGERAVVFSHRLEPLRVLQQRIAARWGNGASVLLIARDGRHGARTSGIVFSEGRTDSGAARVEPDCR